MNSTHLERTFQRSVLTTVGLSSLILARAEGPFLPVGLTPFILLMAYVLNDRRQIISVSILFANLLGIVAAIATGVEFLNGDLERKLLSGAHMLSYLTWIIAWMKKGLRQYWWLAALSVLQLAVAAILTLDATLGASLIGMLLMLVWTLSVFTLYRAQLRVTSETIAGRESAERLQFDQTTSLIQIENGLQLDSDERWMGWRFRSTVLLTFLGSLAVSGLVFAAFPRIWVESAFSEMATERSQRAPVQHTGFTEEVQLGDLGTILQSNNRVLQFAIRDEANQSPVALDAFTAGIQSDEIRFRCNALGFYRNRQWTRLPVEESQNDYQGDGRAYRQLRGGDPGQDVFVVKATLDPPLNSFLPVVFPITDARLLDTPNRVTQRLQNMTVQHQIRDPQKLRQPLSYEFHTARAESAQKRKELLESVVEYLQTGNRIALIRARKSAMMHDLQDTLPRLFAFTNELCRDDGELVLPGERVDRIISHLMSPDFSYSLTLDVSDESLDPVEDFLFNRKSGHCEYFASACALMLQSVDIPARVVNGFKGSEENAVTGFHEVKQKHAHSWVEAYVDYKWTTLDPTPAAARAEGVSKVSFGFWSDLRSAFSDGWFALVKRVSFDEQKALLRSVKAEFDAVMATIRQQGLIAAAKLFFRNYVLSPQRWFSWQGGLMTFLLLSICALIVRRHPWRAAMRWMRMLQSRFSTETRAARTVVRFYDAFCGLCDKHGLSFSADQTALENATQASEFFADQLARADAVGIPFRVADTFNQVRFGSHRLTAEQSEWMRQDILAFSTCLAAAASDP